MDKKDALMAFFARFDRPDWSLFESVYAEDAQFVDPVVKLSTRRDIRGYFEHGLKETRLCRFHFNTEAKFDHGLILEWRVDLVHDQLNGGEHFHVDGVSRITFNLATGMVSEHRDYFNLTDLVHDRLPVLSWLNSKLKHKMVSGLGGDYVFS